MRYRSVVKLSCITEQKNRIEQKARSSVYCGKMKVKTEGNTRTDCGRLFRTDAAAARKARSPVVQ